MLPFLGFTQLILSVIYLKRYNESSSFLKVSLISLPIILVFFFFSVRVFPSSAWVYTFTLMLGTILIKWLYENRKLFWIGCYFIFLIGMGLSGLPNYCAYIDNLKESTTDISVMNFKNSDLEQVELPENKIIVLDFWTSRCGACFAGFKDLQQVQKEFKHKTNVEFYSINVRLRNESHQDILSLVNSMDYEFKYLFIESVGEAKKASLNGYPSLLVFKNGELEYDGTLETSPFVFINRLDNLIHDLLE